MNDLLSRLEVQDERDIARARQHARAIAARLGFGARDQAGIASAVSEVAVDAIRHAGGGRVEFRLDGDPARSLAIRIIDQRPGGPKPGEVRNLDDARGVMDGFEVDIPMGLGTAVAMAKALPDRAPPVSPSDAEEIADELLGLDPPSPADEFSRQDRELLRAILELEAREREVDRAHHELSDTHQGIMALHAELGERADSLERAGEMRTLFLSNVSHELRTPLSSILGLARLLLDRVDGDLSVEQDRQVSFILRSALDLADLVEDLLDLARIEAGREVVRPSEVHLPGLFAALRGMIRPLLPPDSAVDLVIDDPSGLPPMVTDVGKLSLVLRNLLSNALKFTGSGEVRLEAEPGPEGAIVFSVSDTGIGIAPEHLHLIFEEFGQVDGPPWRQAKGTGLGLPLARKFARLLGGEVAVRSEPGVGSTFTATIPIRLPGGAEEPPCDAGL